MEDRKTLRVLSESLREILTRGMPEAEAWEWFFRVVQERIAGRRPRSRSGGRRAKAVARARELLCDSGAAARIDQALADATALGWMHQYWVNADKSLLAARMRAKQGHSIGRAEVIAASSVYSTRVQVRFLLQNSLGRMWVRMHPRSRLRDQWEYFIEGDCSSPISSIEGVTLIDPACGCGHFLVEALDMMFLMYRERWGIGRHGGICSAILKRNLFGLDIDPRAVRVAKSALVRKCLELEGVVPEEINIERARGEGALAVTGGPSRASSLLKRKFSIVATNPPFVGYRKLAPGIKDAIARAEPLAANDMAAAFVSRGFSMIEQGGLLAVVTPAAWLTSTPLTPLRRRIVSEGGPRVVASLGQRVFETAPLLFVSLAVAERGSEGEAAMVRAEGEKDLAAACRRVKRNPLSRIRADPSCSFAPGTSVLPLASCTRTALTGDFFAFADGVWTGDNARDTRRWGEVAGDDPEWMPVSGGHGGRRWYGPITRAIRASACSAWIHLPKRRGCLEYSRVAGGRLAARVVLAPTAALAGVVSMLPRPDTDRRHEVLAVFNSRAGTLWLRALTSGLNFNPGYAARVPIPAEPLPEALRGRIDRAVALARELARRQPGCQDFVPGLADDRQDIEDRLAALEREIDLEIASIMGIRRQHLDEVRLRRRTPRSALAATGAGS